MTMPHPGAKALVDAGNTLLGPSPASLDTGSIETPDGVLGVVTVRTSSATLTLFLAAPELREWSRVLDNLALQLGGTVATAAPQDLSLLTQLARSRRHG